MLDASSNSCSLWSIPYCTFPASHGCFHRFTVVLPCSFWVIMQHCQCLCLSITYPLYSARISHAEHQCKLTFTDSVCDIYRLNSTQEEAVQDPFWHSVGSAVQWYDILQVQVERHVEASLQVCRDRIKTFKGTSSTLFTQHTSTFIVSPAHLFTTPVTSSPSRPSSDVLFKGAHTASTPGSILFSEVSLISRSCVQTLVQHCPVCFSRTIFGKSLTEGGDIHVSTDGIFHHRHRRSAGNCPPFYNPAYFLLKTQVDAMGEHIEKQCKKPAKCHNITVPDEALDSCESSYEATDWKKQKTLMESFDNTGLMALICHHDIPLFFCQHQLSQRTTKICTFPH